MREPGFYWVEVRRAWDKRPRCEPAYWNGKRWEAIGLDFEVDDDNWVKIGPKAEPPEELIA